MTQISPSGAADLRYLKGVGPKRALIFEKIGVRSVRDLLFFFPRRYEDRSRFSRVADLQIGEMLSFRAEVLAVNLRRLRGAMTLLDVTLGDESGTIHAVWFNQPYLKNQFSGGQEMILYGRADWYKDRIQISSPEYEILDEDRDPIHALRITPVYPLTEGLYQRSLRKTLYELVQHPLSRYLEEYFPPFFLNKHRLMPLPEAVAEMHFPSSFEKQADARRRIVFDEFFLFEWSLLRKMVNLRSRYAAHPIECACSAAEELKARLPFSLTPGQTRAMTDIANDLEKKYPMNRLLQGDVGSGKTVVAAFALLAAARSELQGAILVPTEILAEQHYKNLAQIFSMLSIPVGLLTSSTPGPRREKILADLKNGRLPVVVGTHALLQEDVQWKALAVLVIDEQHKFGVHQRCRLLQRHPRPHQLVMTATPIPRTLALTVFGDLDVSVIAELPVGRKPVATYWITREKQPEI
jgi:ATP-dependent DNA helicase RecG